MQEERAQGCGRLSPQRPGNRDRPQREAGAGEDQQWARPRPHPVGSVCPPVQACTAAGAQKRHMPTSKLTCAEAERPERIAHFPTVPWPLCQTGQSSRVCPAAGAAEDQLQRPWPCRPQSRQELPTATLPGVEEGDQQEAPEQGWPVQRQGPHRAPARPQGAPRLAPLTAARPRHPKATAT